MTKKPGLSQDQMSLMLMDFSSDLRRSMKTEDKFFKFLKNFPYGFDLSERHIASTLHREFRELIRSFTENIFSERVILESFRCWSATFPHSSKVLMQTFLPSMKPTLTVLLYKAIEADYSNLVDYLLRNNFTHKDRNFWDMGERLSVSVATVLLKHDNRVARFLDQFNPKTVLRRMEILSEAGYEFQQLNRDLKAANYVPCYLTSSIEVCKTAQSLGIDVFPDTVCHIHPNVMKRERFLTFAQKFQPFGLDVNSKDKRGRDVLFEYVVSHYNIIPGEFSRTLFEFRKSGVRLRIRAKLLTKWLTRDTVHPHARHNKLTYGRWRSEIRLIELAIGLKALDLPVSVVLEVYRQTEIRPEYLMPPIESWEICKKVKQECAL